MPSLNCRYCQKPIRVMVFRENGWCSDLCRKKDLGEIDVQESGK